MRRASITDGWDGRELDGKDCPNWTCACEYIQRNAYRYARRINEVWCYTRVGEGPGRVVVDVGDWRIYGRIAEKDGAV